MSMEIYVMDDQFSIVVLIFNLWTATDEDVRIQWKFTNEYLSP